MFTLGNRKSDQELRENLAEYVHDFSRIVLVEALVMIQKELEILGYKTIEYQKLLESVKQVGSYENDSEESKLPYRLEADKIIKILLSHLTPRCEDCGAETSPGTGLEKGGRLTVLCQVCQGKRLAKFKVG